jgi:hypothetical protein
MKPKTEQWEADSPVILEPDADADIIGNHLARVHDVATRGAYDTLGVKVDTTYQVEETKGGKRVVHIVENREKI